MQAQKQKHQSQHTFAISCADIFSFFSEDKKSVLSIWYQKAIHVQSISISVRTSMTFPKSSHPYKLCPRIKDLKT